MSVLSKLCYWLATLLTVFGLPVCMWVYFAGQKKEVAMVTEEWLPRATSLPGTIIVLSILALFFGRNPERGGLPQSARSWALAMIVMSALMSLLLFTESPYRDPP